MSRGHQWTADLAKDWSADPSKLIILYSLVYLLKLESVIQRVQTFLDYAQPTCFFSLYSSPPGRLLNEEGWYSATPEGIASQITVNVDAIPNWMPCVV
ncbi:hypothetical protein BDP27DRAFT_451221 [Rhodocollybia butyracea]|uniref:Uncharacterized protein n=1 Tax=Rhodocollybia butyracea TaxID=206335 RepID=A0A9P5TYZ4_9AGAR|nr:hypothetical protein BDP27DRAFT_451221 [Rhodocollybia butyracea]